MSPVLTQTQIKEYLLSQQDIVAAYLFGSVATGQAHPGSDLDFALLLNKEVSEVTAFDLRLKVGAELAQITSRPVDIVVLNQSPPLLLFQVFRDGRLIFERDKETRCLFQMQALNRYYDFKPYLEFHQAHFKERVLQEGLGRGYKGHRDALAKARRISEKLAATGSGSTG